MGANPRDRGQGVPRPHPQPLGARGLARVRRIHARDLVFRRGRARRRRFSRHRAADREPREPHDLPAAAHRAHPRLRRAGRRARARHAEPAPVVSAHPHRAARRQVRRPRGRPHLRDARGLRRGGRGDRRARARRRLVSVRGLRRERGAARLGVPEHRRVRVGVLREPHVGERRRDRAVVLLRARLRPAAARRARAHGRRGDRPAAAAAAAAQSRRRVPHPEHLRPGDLHTMFGAVSAFPAALASPLFLGPVMLAWIVAPLGLAAWRFNR